MEFEQVQLHQPLTRSHITDLEVTRRVQIQQTATSLTPGDSEHEQHSDDWEIEELLSSFYFDSSDKYYSEETSSQVTIERLNPIYEQDEDEMFYDLYGHGAEHPSGSYSHKSLPCSTSTLGSDDDMDETSAEKDKDQNSLSSELSSEISSSPQSEFQNASQYNSRLLLTELPEPSSSSHPPSSLHWPVVEEDDYDEPVGFGTGEDEGEGFEGDVEMELEEREHRGRSRAVPVRLARWVTSSSGPGSERTMSRKKPPQMHNREG